MRFVVPRELHSGSVVRFENHADDRCARIHHREAAQGKTAADVREGGALPRTAPRRSTTRAEPARSPGGREWFTLDLAPGRYVAFCMVPDDKTGIPHAATGMVKVFSVDDD